MKYLLAWWLVGCLLVGAQLGYREKACPNEQHQTPSDLVQRVAVFPVYAVWSIIDSNITACR